MRRRLACPWAALAGNTWESIDSKDHISTLSTACGNISNQLNLLNGYIPL